MLLIEKGDQKTEELENLKKENEELQTQMKIEEVARQDLADERDKMESKLQGKLWKLKKDRKSKADKAIADDTIRTSERIKTETDGEKTDSDPEEDPSSSDEGSDKESKIIKSSMKSGIKETDYKNNQRKFTEEIAFWEKVLKGFTKDKYGYYKIPKIQITSIFGVRTSKWKI